MRVGYKKNLPYKNIFWFLDDYKSRFTTSSTVWPAQRSNFTESVVESMNQTIWDLPSGYQHNWWWAKASDALLPSWIRHSRDFDTLSETGADYDTAKTKLDKYFSPKKNINYEIFQFHQATQQPIESVKQFAMRLRKLFLNCAWVSRCQFGNHICNHTKLYLEASALICSQREMNLPLILYLPKRAASRWAKPKLLVWKRSCK